MKKTFAILFLSIMMLCTYENAMAQPEGWDDASSQDTPVDGGLSLLIAAGVGYGVKRVRDQRAKAAEKS